MVPDENDLNAEFIRFTNMCDSSVKLDGWSLDTKYDQTFQFPTGATVDPYETMTVHSGSGTDTPTEMHWGRTEWLLNSIDDSISIRDSIGDLIDQQSVVPYLR